MLLDLHTMAHVYQGLLVNERLEKIVGNVLVACSNMLHFAKVALFHNPFDAFMSPIVSDLIVQILFGQQITQLVFDHEPNARRKSQYRRKLFVRIELGEKVIVARQQVKKLYFGDSIVRGRYVVENDRQKLSVELFLHVAYPEHDE